MSIARTVLEEFDDQLPSDPAEQRQVFRLGLRELRIRKALEAYRRGEGSLAFAARQADVPLREMIPLAYAHGFEPKVDPELLDGGLTPEQAADL